jgi:hypothetical protein
MSTFTIKNRINAAVYRPAQIAVNAAVYRPAQIAVNA